MNKQCTKCHENKPIAAFSKKTASKDGLNAQCKTCKAIWNSQYRKKHAERDKAQCIRYYQEHREEKKASARRRYKENPAPDLARSRKYREIHTERRGQRYKKHRDQEREQHAQYHKEHIEQERVRRAQYHKEHIEQERAKKLRREVLKRGANVSDFTADQWQQILNRYDWRCAYCGEVGQLTQDHMQPLSRGGDHTASNIIPACGKCNSSKNTKTFLEYLFYTNNREKFANREG